MLELSTPLASIEGIGPRFVTKLARLDIHTVRDLLWHFPFRYEDFSQMYKIGDLEPGQQATVRGVVETVDLRRSWRRGMVIVEAAIADETGVIRAIWFNQPYVKTALRIGRLANFSGKVTFSQDELYLSHPTYELISTHDADETRHTGRLVPIYPETRGLTSKGLRFLIQPLLKSIARIPEWMPPEVLEENNFPEINDALYGIHFPEVLENATAAKRRFSFEDIFLLQIWNLGQKLALARERAPRIPTDIELMKKNLAALPFTLTLLQKKSLWEIIRDLEKDRPMNRLLQGDVGSGKTVVAALAGITAAQNGFQSAFMAPTEVLAHQHFLTLKKLFAGIAAAREFPIGILSAGGAKIFYENDLETSVKKDELREKIKRGEIKIVVGTHALIQKSVIFEKLGLVIIDEQHRFGVNQRAILAGRRQTLTETRTNADNATENNSLLYEDLTYVIRGCALKVKEKLGLGHKERIYQNALVEEFQNAGLIFEREKKIPIEYNGKKLGIYQPDFLVDEKIIIEIKSLPYIGKGEHHQLWTYLKGSPYKLALLINFSPDGIDFKRVIYETARISQRMSASSPRESALVPHFLSMSATPIPRTLMLSVFGDLDISTITELPAGRKNIMTKIVAPENRAKAYVFIRAQAKKGRQAFVICPRIEPQTNADNTRTYADTNDPHTPMPASNVARINQRQSASSPRMSAPLWEIKAVKEEYEKLSKKIFPDLRVAMLHGQMKPKEKEKIMADFKNRKSDVLVATSVVEVGVDVPNATIMMIEGSDRFGLAQLYQFRGRVGRGAHQSFCFLFTDSSAKTTQARLKAILEAKNGFELAEKDLEIRGPGEFLGQKQTGIPDIAMAGLQDIELIKSSRAAAVKIVQTDPLLKKNPALRVKLEEFKKRLHTE